MFDRSKSKRKRVETEPELTIEIIIPRPVTTIDTSEFDDSPRILQTHNSNNKSNYKIGSFFLPKGCEFISVCTTPLAPQAMRFKAKIEELNDQAKHILENISPTAANPEEDRIKKANYNQMNYQPENFQPAIKRLNKEAESFYSKLTAQQNSITSLRA